jgi:hypothetical protein
MEIYIDGHALDATLENEKTVGDILASLEGWLSGAKRRLAAIAIDGNKISSNNLDAAFLLDLANCVRIDVETSSIMELYAEALLSARFYIEQKLGQKIEAKTHSETVCDIIVPSWDASGGRSFLGESYPVFAVKLDGFILRGTGDGKKLEAEIGERLTELANPVAALISMKETIHDITARLESLPLDIQMGKDREASETVFAFSEIAGRIFRILSFTPKSAAGHSENDTFFEEFSGVLKEFLSAYEMRDSVLIGDLAEYEVSPRLSELYERLSTTDTQQNIAEVKAS